MTELEKSDKIRGQILVIALHTEEVLDSFISNYICSPFSNQEIMLKDLILIEKVNFNNKTRIFEEICKLEGIDQGVEIAKKLDRIRQIRNIMAHTPPVQLHDGTRPKVFAISRKTTEFKEEKFLEIREELVEEINNLSSIACQEIMEIQAKYINLEKRIQESESFIKGMKNPEVLG
jgi:hypothetical protein